MSGQTWYHFGPFRFDGRLLYRGDERLELPEREAQILLLLVEQAPHLVKKQELLKIYGARADPNNVDQAVTRLRRVLGDRNDGKPRSHLYIDTVQGEGYVFKHAVQISREARPELRVDYYAGLEWLSTREPEAIWKAKECFEAVLRREPTFARAHAALAECYATLGSHSWMPPAVAAARGKAAAEKALRFDDTLAEPYATLGFIHSLFEQKWAEAKHALELSVERAPNYCTGRHRYALYLAATGQLTRALEEIERAKELDPLSRTVEVHVATVLYWSRQYDAAERRCRGALSVDRTFWYGHYQLAVIYEQQGRFGDAVEAHRHALESFAGRYDVLTVSLARAYALAGQREECLRLLDQLGEPDETRGAAFFHLATAHAALGDADTAFGCLTSACEHQEVWVSFLAVDPRWDDLRGDPRFAEMLTRLGLP